MGVEELGVVGTWKTCLDCLCGIGNTSVVAFSLGTGTIISSPILEVAVPLPWLYCHLPIPILIPRSNMGIFSLATQ